MTRESMQLSARSTVHEEKGHLWSQCELLFNTDRAHYYTVEHPNKDSGLTTCGLNCE